MATTGRTLQGTVGVSVATLLLSVLPQLEGMRLRGYHDPIGVVTACVGDTNFAVLGKAYTRAECNVILQHDLLVAAVPVLKCVPGLAGQTGPLAASVSLAFNVGASAFCKSTMARKFNSGDYVGACAQLPRWNRAGGKISNGLIARRKTEEAICEGRYGA
jgi:lysozyme